MADIEKEYKLGPVKDKSGYRDLLAHARRREKALRSERDSWESHWKDLSRHFMPLKGRFEGEERNDGRKNKRGKPLFDSVGVYAANTLASGMQSGLTPQSSAWFRLVFQDAALSEIESGKTWLQTVQDRFEQILNSSNFYGQIGPSYKELGVFGTSVVLLEDDVDSVIRFKTLTVGQYWIGTNAADRVDTLLYVQQMTPRQIIEKFGDWTPETVRAMARRDNEQAQEIMCLIEPRKEFNRFSKHPEERPYACIFYLKGGGEDAVLSVSGFYEFPALCPRWDITGTDVYGISPGMLALADCRVVQAVAEDSVIALRREVRPALLIPARVQFPGSGVPDLSQDVINIYNGADQTSASPVLPVSAVKANLPAAVEFLGFYRTQIERNFHVDMFLMLDMENKNMTATEVNARNAEKMSILGPVLDRLRSDLFQGMVDRMFNIMVRRGLLPEPPQEIQGAPLKIEFMSTLAQAQQSAKLVPQDNLVQRVLGVYQAYPEILDVLNFDKFARVAAELSGANPAILRGVEEVEAMRKQRAEQQAAQQQMVQQAAQIEMAQGVAATERDMSQAAQGVMQ